MRKELIVKGRSLAGVSDLTLFAPIRQGFVPSLDAVSYKTRLQMLLKTLGASRSSSQEYSLVRPFSDGVERVSAIHSVRLAIVEPENKLMLAATFDGAWETYIRTLWLKVGTLLDAIFCNTQDYVTAHGHTCDEWGAWVRRVQAETQFFYGMPALSVPDVQYLRSTERMQRQAQPSGDVDAATARTARPEDAAWEGATSNPKSGDPVDPLRAAETVRQGLQALAVLYRLADVYLPGTPDGDILLRAARDLLLEWVELGRTNPPPPALPPAVAERFARQLAWFARETPERERRQPAATPYDRSDVQGGILGSFDGVTHGCLLLIAFPSAPKAADLLQKLLPLVTRDNAKPAVGEVIRNVGFTCEGLRALGLTEAELGVFPPEFREGMEARAGVLGDLRTNHPRRWAPPRRNWPHARPDNPVVELSAVHMVVQLRVGSTTRSPHFDDLADPGHPLHAEIVRLVGTTAMTLLSVQPMWRNFDGKTTREHFGFADGISQPIVDPAVAQACGDRPAHLGDILLGYPNTFDPAPSRHDLLHNGSFLVIRKLRQDVAALDKTVVAGAGPLNLTREELLAKMMGRRLDGTPLVPTGPKGLNDFDYTGDPQGLACPIQAHVRRANPRPGPAPRTDRETPVPRIMRRGMSYGPPYNRADSQDPANARERGIVFMAYNARIAEQFEVIQRWLSGGNSSGGLSANSDPFLGVPQRGDPRTFRFADGPATGPTVKRVALDDPANPLDDPKRPPFVRLEWGAYLFAPSLKALAALQRVASNVPKGARPAWSVREGASIIAHLKALESQPGHDLASMWKTVLEDPTHKREFQSASVWAAVRECHGGVLRTPFGVLVAGRKQVDEVFADPHQRYTVRGYRERTGLAFGEIYLGLDRDAPDGDYDREASRTNAAIQQISLQAAFELAERYARKIIDERIALDRRLAKALGKPTWELNLDTKEVTDDVLAHLCEEWFGLPGPGHHLQPGSLHWDWEEGEPPLYPGHFTAPSRYVFQPAPGACPMQIGQRHGQALRAAVRAFAQEHQLAGTVPSTPSKAPACVGAAIFNDPRAGFTGHHARPDPDWFARTFVGALVGFLPSVDGNFRATLNEWLSDGEFWRLRSRLLGHHGSDAFTKAQAVLWTPMERAMQLRPLPETVWRTARKAHRLGSVEIQVDDLVVVAIVSAMQDDLAAGRSGVYPVFGGRRRAGAPQPGHPTHACPGYEAGMGALLGLYSALMAVPETMRPSPAPLSLTLTGPTPP